MSSTGFKQHGIDLAAARTGGETIACSDDFFAPMENLLKPGRGIFVEDRYTDQGKWMDGWESRRSYGRDNGRDFDWCVIKLGLPGVVKSLDIDTNHFQGNAPQRVSVEACAGDELPDKNVTWEMLLPQTMVEADSQNLFEIDNPQPYSYLRLNMFPDGGIARFRVYGEVDPGTFLTGKIFNLAGIENGARGLLCSDMFFSDLNNLLLPGRGINMGDGWETRRRRDPGPDWAVVRLACEGFICKVTIDTAHFKGNYPDRFSLEGTVSDDGTVSSDVAQWQVIIPETKLHPDREHVFVEEIESTRNQTFTHVRLNIYPDGGISRLRLFGGKKEQQ